MRSFAQKRLVLVVVAMVAYSAAGCRVAEAQKSKQKSPEGKKAPQRQGQSRKAKMADVFTTYWDRNPVDLAVTPVPIRPATTAFQPARAPAAADGAGRRCFINDARNSRVPHPAGTNPWRQRWRSELSGAAPVCLMSAGDRILIQGPLTWSLWTTEGKHIRAGSLQFAAVSIDRETARFFSANNAGLVQAWRVDDGTHSFSVALYYGHTYGRTFIARRDQRLLTVSTELPEDPHGLEPENSIIEVTDLKDREPRSYDQPGGPVVMADLIAPTKLLITALHDRSAVVATTDRVYRLNLDLKFQAALTGSFTPKVMSLDEAGRIYLVAESDGRTNLWLMSPEGERYYSFLFPPGATTEYPPIIGYDHTVYLITGEHVVAVGTDGKLKWSRSPGGRIAGAVITTDDRLVVAAGSEILAYDSKGERRTLFQASGDSFVTPPIFTDASHLVVASAGALYSLETGK